MHSDTDVTMPTVKTALQSLAMELKHLVQRCVYRIEPKPEGGFIARATDPSVPPIEAATREEVQKKIQAKLVAALGEAFPGLKLPEPGKQVTYAMHVERKPAGGFSVHSDNPGTPGFNPASQEKFDHYTEQLLGFVDQHFPHLSEQIASQVVGRNLQVFTTTTSSFTKQSSPLSQVFQPTHSMPSSPEGLVSADAGVLKSSGLDPSLLTNVPITPEASKSGAVVRVMLFALIVLVMMYFVFFRR
jgi:hypothetical protein